MAKGRRGAGGDTETDILARPVPVSPRPCVAASPFAGGHAHQATLVIVAYDVRDRRRLRRVAAMMEQYGVRVQHSAFECRLDNERIRRLLDDIKRVINRRHDKVTVIELCQPCVQRSERFIKNGVTTDANVYVC